MNKRVDRLDNDTHIIYEKLSDQGKWNKNLEKKVYELEANEKTQDSDIADIRSLLRKLGDKIDGLPTDLGNSGPQADMSK